jgi:hypothetical protein
VQSNKIFTDDIYINKYITPITDDIIDYYWMIKNKCFTNMRIIKYSQQLLNMDINHKIQFVNIYCNHSKFQMTYTFFKESKFMEILEDSLSNDFCITTEI